MKRKSCGSLTIGLTPPTPVHTPNTPEILNTIVSITSDAPCSYSSHFIKEGLKIKVKKKMDIVTEDSLHKVLSQNVKEEIEVIK